MWEVSSFLDNLQYERICSEETVKAYRDDIFQFYTFVTEGYGEVSPSDVTSDFIREWIISMMNKGYTSTSINRKLSALRTFYKYLLRCGKVSVDPLRKITGPKNKKALPSFLKESEMNRLLDETDFGEGFPGCRDKLIIAMFYATGIRLSELVDLEGGNVDIGSSLIKVIGKRRKERLIPFDEELRGMIAEYLRLKADLVIEYPSQAFFVREDGRRLSRSIVENIVKRNLSKVVTLKKRSPHVLRHTFATAMLNHNAELGAIKELLGHESLATTEIYTHTTFEELKKVYNQAHPRA